MDVRFGLWSTALLAGSVHGLVVACLLWRTSANRHANRALAGLLVVVVLMITPYTIGYAGFYDAWPWLTFAPFFWQLAFGPLLWLYVRQLAHPSLPRYWAWHLLPAMVQGTYYMVLFVHLLAWKGAWSDAVHVPYVLPVQSALIGVSLAVYWSLALREYVRWQRWLLGNSAAREEHRLTWLRRFLWLTGAVIVCGAGFALWDMAIRHLSYFDEFPLYLVFTALVYVLGIEGWRHAAQQAPHMEMAVPAVAPVPPQVDWPERGRQWAAQVEAAQWYRQPDLSLAELARKLGTNTAYLSRAFNDGLDVGFSAVINRMRVAAACRELDAGDSVLAVAMNVGFGSKATFNRVFREVSGCTPSAWRKGREGRLISEKTASPGESGTL